MLYIHKNGFEIQDGHFKCASYEALKIHLILYEMIDESFIPLAKLSVMSIQKIIQ